MSPKRAARTAVKPTPRGPIEYVWLAGSGLLFGAFIVGFLDAAFASADHAVLKACLVAMGVGLLLMGVGRPPRRIYTMPLTAYSPSQQIGFRLMRSALGRLVFFGGTGIGLAVWVLTGAR